MIIIINSERPVPDLKAQGCDPLIHRGKPQHETAELGGNKQQAPARSSLHQSLMVPPAGFGPTAGWPHASHSRLALLDPMRSHPDTPGWETDSAIPGNIMCLDFVVLIKAS
ncbi:hypothetical protein ILYODFUR_026044 [Ilyodon furcidens]|uniref:Uncharacterized protein n=1 Tax=Ilyodon furcidens TaxID=33524 RepID=A0ABV0TLQ7_9TELE